MEKDSTVEKSLKVAIIGTSGAGKTCFIAAMRWLGECGDDARFISVGANGDSKAYLDDLHEVVKAGYVPQGTPTEFKLEFSERYVLCDGKPPVQIDFSIRDFKGGELCDLDASSPLFQSWSQSDLLLVLLDIEKIQKRGIELGDNLRDLSAVLVRNEMDASQKRLAIVITQADKGGFSAERHSPEEAEDFLSENLPNFVARIRESRFKEAKCYLLASIGLEPETNTDGKSNRVLELDGKREWRPFGYEELFDWICSFQRKEELEKFWAWICKRCKPYVTVLTILAICGVVWCGVVRHRQTAAKSEYENGNSRIEDKGRATWKMSEKDRIDAVENRISAYEKQAESLNEDVGLRNLLSREKSFFNNAKVSEEQGKRIFEIDDHVQTKMENILVERIKYAMGHNNYKLAEKLICQYRGDKHISRRREKEVNGYSKEVSTKKRNKEKTDIAKSILGVGDPKNTTRMCKVLERIENFDYPNLSDKEDAKNAVKAMSKLIAIRHYFIKRINGIGLENKRKTYVLIASNVEPKTDLKDYRENSSGMLVETQEVDSTDPQWNDERLVWKELTWKPGQNIRVEWRRNAVLSDKCIAYKFSSGGWTSLLEILQPAVQKNGYDNFKGDPEIIIHCEEFPYPEKDLKLIKRYVIPGDYWREP